MHIYITVVALVQRPLATAFETIMSPHLFKCDFNIFWNDYFHINPYMADFQNQIDIQDLAIKLAAIFTTPVPLSPSSLSPRMSWSRLFNRQFSSLRRRISWVLGSSSTDEFELMLRLRFGFKRCSRPFSGSDLLEIWEGTSELSDKLPSPHSNIVRCYKQCTCVLMWQQISGKALRCAALHWPFKSPANYDRYHTLVFV